MVQSLWKTVQQSLQKVKHTDTTGLRIFLLHIHPREMTTCPHKDLHMNVHSSITQKSQKAETTQISMQYIHTIKYDLAIKRNEAMICATTWMKLANIVFQLKKKKPVTKSEEALQIVVKRREAKSKGEKERYSHLNAEFQRLARKSLCVPSYTKYLLGKNFGVRCLF